MIVVARYPNGFRMNQLQMPFAGMGGYTAAEQNYKQAVEHYQSVIQWCKEYLSGPWDCNERDILYDGIRVRIGTEIDVAFFKLKWD